MKSTLNKAVTGTKYLYLYQTKWALIKSVSKNNNQKRHCIIVKGSIQQENIAFVNMHST